MGPAILVVDDDEDARDILSIALDAEGFEAQTACDGQDALDHLRRSAKPAIILLDLMMPRMDGESFMRSLRADAAWADIPVVVMSGDNATHERAQAISAQAGLVKPVDFDELLAVVARFGVFA